MNPKVSLLIPFRDTHAPWFKIALHGAAIQSYDNLDVVVCDNGSTKASTLEVLKMEMEEHPDRIIATKESKPGTAYALDACLNACDTDTVYLSKFDSDDIIHPDREANRVRLMETLPPQVGGMYENFYMLNYLPRPHIQPIILRPYDYRAHLNESYIPGNFFWKASVYDAGIPRTFVFEGYEGKANRHGEDYNKSLEIGDKFDFFWLNCDPAMSWTYRFTGNSKYSSDRKGVDYCRTLLQQRAKERRGLL